MTISRQVYANNAKTTLAGAITPSTTSIQVSDGSRFPVPGVGEYFLVTLEAGSTIEVIRVNGRTGNTFTSVERAQENTVAANFPAGARADNRVTRDMMANLARLVDRLGEVNSVDDLDTPLNSNANSYICHNNDDSGNPIVAFKSTSVSWRFNTHRIVVSTGSLSSGTSTSASSVNIGSIVSSVVTGKYIIQFFTGANAGLVRNITSSASNTVSWTTALPNALAAADQFEIYKSDASIIGELLNTGDDGLIYSILLSE